MNVLNVLQLAPVPWRNGQGQTREIETFPSGAGFDDFIWRISLADIGQAGDFSAFDGVDRIITLVKGSGVNLNFNDGERHTLEYGVPYPFAGERPLHATLQNGPVQDLNLMLRRGLAAGRVQAWSATSAWPCTPGTAYRVLCLQGAWQLHVERAGAAPETATLSAFDYVSVPDQATHVHATPKTPDGLILVADIQASPPPGTP
ncbi:HutD/Ves family protein [Pusillimonas minor]|uniref:HutD family protein n=1 Tax=Pusillimonas minor TaxID=2697024 RepID=A0A842HSZ6_9BURK|nr:HutD family protein [Pusillimonas minor]MBC2770540.1 HutD family protein [Pusillimonas minor]